MSSIDIAKRHFQSETKNHKMLVIREDDLYRHIRFKQSGTSAYYFDLVTYPGYLVFSGDMGTWVFKRITDMFDFFGGDRINAGYWAEKLQHGAGGGRDIAREYSPEATEKVIKERFDWWVICNEATIENGYTQQAVDRYQRMYEHNKGELKDLLDNIDDEWSITEAIYNISDGGFECGPFYDDFDLVRKDYSHHYLWACFAIQWGINRYRNNKVAIKAIDTFLSFK